MVYNEKIVELTKAEKCRNGSGAAELEWRGGHDFGCGEDAKFSPRNGIMKSTVRPVDEPVGNEE